MLNRIVPCITYVAKVKKKSLISPFYLCPRIRVIILHYIWNICRTIEQQHTHNDVDEYIATYVRTNTYEKSDKYSRVIYIISWSDVDDASGLWCNVVSIGDARAVDSIRWCYIDLCWTVAVVWLFFSFEVVIRGFVMLHLMYFRGVVVLKLLWYYIEFLLAGNDARMLLLVRFVSGLVWWILAVIGV